MLALGMVKSLVTLYQNTPLYKSALRLLNDIIAPLSPDENEDGGKTAWYESCEVDTVPTLQRWNSPNRALPGRAFAVPGMSPADAPV
jgi:hypothetical protein